MQSDVENISVEMRYSFFSISVDRCSCKEKLMFFVYKIAHFDISSIRCRAVV